MQAADLEEEATKARLDSAEGGDKASTPPRKPPTTSRTRDHDPLDEVQKLPIEHQVLLCALGTLGTDVARFTEVFQRYKMLLTRLLQPLDAVSKPQVNFALSAMEQMGLLSIRGKGSAAGVLLTSSPTGRGRPSGGNAEVVAELAVSRKALRDTLGKANSTLLKCLE
eukprot:TRINITY_DN1186_c0_g1_i2.p1 TRINITY_DN1186_c0_g1~~TRINITY_DN1186_c0_g1_i2.p1  ORF type:complete len:167 (+),score=46.08 TRINITY_DN1186_c0_g1_i2:596-1096(+)